MMIVKTPKRGIPAAASELKSSSAGCEIFERIFVGSDAWLRPTGIETNVHNFARLSIPGDRFWVVDDLIAMHPLGGY